MTRSLLAGARWAAGGVAAIVLIRYLYCADLFGPSEEELMRMKNISYMQQERSISIGNARLKKEEDVLLFNSDPLPARVFSESPASMCAREDAGCVPPHAYIPSLIVTSPDHRLASCIVQKSMSTVMAALFCFLTRQKDFIQQGRSLLREYSNIRMCRKKNEYHSLKGMQGRLGLSDSELDRWRLTMVTRDPVDRFLSGFIDRCIRVGDPCFGCRQNMTCFMIEEHKRMLAYADADRKDTLRPKPTAEDIHVFPQNWRCNVGMNGRKYELLKYSNNAGDGLLNQLTTVLRQSNVSESAISFITASMTSGRTAHSTVTSPARAILERRLRESPFLMELITRMFYFDYRYLKYPLPKL